MNLKELLKEREELEDKASEIRASIADELEDVQVDLDSIKDNINEVISGPIEQGRLKQGKGNGVFNAIIDGVQVKHDIPKIIAWDQDKLAGVYVKIEASGDDPQDYINIKYNITETKYKAFPDAIKNVFNPARTVKDGKAKITFKMGDK